MLDERLVGAPGVHAYDPLRLAIDVRGTGATGYELAAPARARRRELELFGENVMVAVFGMAEPVRPRRLVEALRHAVERWTAGGHRARGASPRRRPGASW